MITLESAVPEAKNMETSGQLFQQLLALADSILDGYNSQIASLAGNTDMTQYTTQLEEKYMDERRNLIAPFCKLSLLFVYTNCSNINTVNTRYLDILGTLQKMSRYPNVNVDTSMLTNSVSV